MAPKPDPKPKFQEGERVLCFHGPLLYEAKCVKVAVKDKQVRYFIHYSGWNKNWDEWVSESRVLKHMEANLQKQRELQKANQEQCAKGKVRGAVSGKKTPGLQPKNLEKPKKTKPKPSNSGEGTSSGQAPQPPRKKRSRLDSPVEPEVFLPYTEDQVKIPEELKRCLVDDWDWVTKQNHLYHLPAQRSVDSILEEFEKGTLWGGSPDHMQYVVHEVAAGIREYFNSTLNTQLLYRFERPQYEAMVKGHHEEPMSCVYGAPHLLRLFVRIEAMVTSSPKDERSLALLLSYLQHFVKYLARNSTSLFRACDYHVASAEYLQKLH
ncbi:mortality factor 4-like protein 1 [Thomomys bottae]